MIKKFTLLLIFCLSICSKTNLFAQGNLEEIKILRFIPNLLDVLAVDPAIPENFVPMTPNEKFDPFDWIYWGPKNVLQDFFKDEEKLSEAIIRVKLAPTIQQEIEDPHARKNFTNEAKSLGFKGLKDSRFRWGDYPVYAIRANHTDPKEKQVLFAWAGLNVPQGSTLKFELLYPKKRKRPNKQDLKLWENFLANTKKLPEPLFFKAHGQDLKEGYTIFNFAGVECKAIAEQLPNKELKIAIIPLSGESEFEVVGILKTLMDAQWNFEKPLAKVYTHISHSDENGSLFLNECLSILIKDVSEFSIDDAAIRDNPRIIVKSL